LRTWPSVRYVSVLVAGVTRVHSGGRTGPGGDPTPLIYRLNRMVQLDGGLTIWSTRVAEETREFAESQSPTWKTLILPSSALYLTSRAGYGC
jgi:hypothetical protein